MIRSISAAFALVVAFTLPLTVRAVENTWDYSVQVSSSVQVSPAKVTLTWPQDTNNTPASYTVHRKAPGETSWGAGTTLSGSTTSYTDTSVAAGNVYEYRIVKVASAYTGYGYIQAAITAPVTEHRGKVVLVVDRSVAEPLASELGRLQQDLAGDGWIVVRRDVARDDSVPSVKAVIKAVYDSDPANVKSVFLFGHVPVPYSGQLNPDGHPDHVGAWPTDAYYGDMDGTWTDTSVNYVQTINTDPVDAARMSNRPGDGKFDQTTLPSVVELEVGRVDLSNLPGRTTWGGPATFASEIELLRKYLNKDHNFRHRITTAPRRAILGDYFGVRGGEAFAASGFRSFAPLVGAENIRNLNREFNDQKGVWISEVSKQDYLLAYGCGAGGYSGISGLGNTGSYHEGSTVEMVNGNVRGVFNLLFGSWLGDWDHEDNILRSPLATDYGLTAAWSGRPHWFLHPMGTGETIGHAARLAMNNSGQYQTQINSSANRIHIALMGDPTLRLHPVAPVSNLNGSAQGGTIALSWRASADSAIVGYHVYRGSLAQGFTRVTESPIAETRFTDHQGSVSATYMVRAIKLEDTTSGSYYNAAQGVFWNLDGSGAPGTTDASAPVIATTQPSTSTPSTSANTSVPTIDPANRTGNVGHTGGATTSAALADPAIHVVPTGAVSAPATPPPGVIVDEPAPATGPSTVTVVATDAYAAIGDANDPGVVTFTRIGDTAPALAVRFTLSGTATKWNDYRRPEGDMPVEITIPAGASSASLSILGKGNSSNAATPTAIFTLAAGSGYSIGAPNSATITLAADAPGPGGSIPTVTVTATDAIARVGNASDRAVLTFSREGGNTAEALVVNYALSGTATKWTDYRRVEGDMPVSVTIPAGATSTTMTIAAYAITAGTPSATAIFTLSPNAAYTLGTPSVATITIANDSWTPPDIIPVTPQIPPNTTDPTKPIIPGPTTAENAAIRIPQVGDYQLRVISPTVLELQRITSGATDWNFVAGGSFNAPAVSQFTVTANDQPVAVSSVGFRRRVAYGTLLTRDLRVDNSLYLMLGTPIAEGAAVEVKNATGALWPATMQFKVTAEAGRYSPAIHVNQEGYVPAFPKKAMVGYYLGNKGELEVDAASGFRLVNATTGETVFSGALTPRKDVGYSTSPLPYQKVLQADFSSFTTPGEYQLVVPGLGASLPFVIDEGVAMAFQRTYALGLYHQRCGCENALPFTRFAHAACHMLPAEIPSGPGYDFHWGVIAGETANAKNNPRHTAPAMVSEATMRYPFVNKGSVDVTGGHHDAGDYSKYTINVANLVHQLIFNADSIAGADALDNLGLPNSGDGISDILQEAKHEADFLARMQDADGGFYFLVYPKASRYESNALPDNGRPQVVWPKTTSVTAASVAALAQMASSPKFKAAYPNEAAAYLAKARLGWQFLTNAIATHGKDGAYQKITHYGDEFMHDDELAWAACELYLATGEAQFQQKLLEWFPNPADPNTMRWTWVRLFEAYGNTIRSYAFAARSGRLPAAALDAGYLAACENQIKHSGDDMLRWSKESAYGTAFPDNTKRIVNAGWYFSLDQACDMAVAYQLNPKPEYIEAIVSNMNYEAGSNPVNVSFIAGLGLKRQREMVNQFGLNDHRQLPPIGLPAGNIAGSYSYLSTYGSELNDLSFPADVANGTGYALQDRWADIWNVTAELVTVQQARAQMATSFLATLTAAKSTAWKPATTLTILASAQSATVGQPITLGLDTAGLDLAGARVTWEARDQQPDFGSTYTITPKTKGAQWIEAEVTWADGRRLFGSAMINAN